MKGTRDMDKLKILFSNLLIILMVATLFSACGTTAPAVPAEEPAAVETTPVVEEKPAEPEGFQVSEEQYTKIFTDIEKLIEDLNKIIRDQDFRAWKKYLTKEYIAHYSDPANLKVISDTPTLKKYNITIRSLNDYFTYVVVPSRSDVSLDDISFIDDNNVKAYMNIDGEPVVLYNLKFIDNSWKIGL